MSPKNAIRRLLKSRLRLHLLEALQEQQPDQAAVLEVERGIAEDAWRAWLSERERYSTRAIHDAASAALQEAAAGVLASFTETIGVEWLVPRIATFVQGFRPSSLEVE